MGLLLLASLWACGGGDPDHTDPPPVPGDLTFTDAHNYAFFGDIEIGAVEVAAQADAALDWCALTTDIRGRAVADPSGIDQLLLIELDMVQEEAEAKVERNALSAADAASAWLVLNPGGCTARFGDFSILGNVFDPAAYFVEDPERSWLVSVVNTPDGRLDILTSTFVVPTAGSVNDRVVVTDASATLTVDADLASADRLLAKEGATPMIDWSAVTADVYGKSYDDLQGDRLLLGKVPVGSIEEAEALFLQLDVVAETLYFLDVYGQTSADLTQATAADGAVFDGFSTDGIWLVGIECLTCTSPAPLLLGVVDVVE